MVRLGERCRAAGTTGDRSCPGQPRVTGPALCVSCSWCCSPIESQLHSPLCPGFAVSDSYKARPQWAHLRPDSSWSHCVPAALEYKGVELKRTGTQRDRTQRSWAQRNRYSRGLEHNLAGIQWGLDTRDLDTTGPGHNGIGTQEDWDTTGLGHKGTGTKEDWDTTEPGHEGIGTQEDWDTTGPGLHGQRDLDTEGSPLVLQHLSKVATPGTFHVHPSRFLSAR